eukprot:TRINITY_DN3029_c0_g1_i1.p1 TRINITY_DN3029_c0_g1~~TRINITY_DN3029_c0_g1_i1.p1  ORF type:complete len:315 (+),score=69.49 TRINITY_DN3029_c0_g1_i1:96-1040(+)
MSAYVNIVCPGHERPVREVSFSENCPDGIFFISASLDKNPMLRKGETGDWLGTFSGHKGAVWTSVISSDATICVTADLNSTCVWDALTGERIHSFPENRRVIKSVDLSKDSKFVISAGMSKTAVIRELDNPENVKTFQHESTVNKVQFIGDDKLVSGCDNGILRIWNWKDEQLLKQIQLSGSIQDIEYSSKHNSLLIAAGKKVEQFDLTKLEIVKVFEMKADVEACSLHPSGQKFLCSEDCAIKCFDMKTSELLDTHTGHHGLVHCVRYLPACDDEKLSDRFCSGADDATVRLWMSESNADLIFAAKEALSGAN